MWNLNARMMRVPYFYWPYLMKDMQYDWPWTKWTVGSKSEWGRFATVKTNALFHDLSKNRLRTGLEYREKRGSAGKLDWRYETPEINSSLSYHLLKETWDNPVTGKPVIWQDRFRFDLYHRQRLNDRFQVIAESHYLTPTKHFFWHNSEGYALSNNGYSSPIPGGIQSRESLLQDYYEDEFRRGRTLENSLSLDYNTDKMFLTLSTLQPVDEELAISKVKDLELRGRRLPTAIAKSQFLYSNDFGLARMGDHFGRSLSAEDQMALFAKRDVEDFKHTRIDILQKIERSYDLWNLAQISPYIGEKLLIYEGLLKNDRKGRASWNIEKEDLEDWKSYNRLVSGLLLSNVITGFFSAGSRELKHQIRPSISWDFTGPSGLTPDMIPVQMDQHDLTMINRLSTVYRLENILYVRMKNGASRKIYNSYFQYLVLNRNEDKIRNFGPDLNMREDAEFSQSIYLQENLRLSSDLRINTFNHVIPYIRNGIHYTLDELQLGWNQVYERNFYIPDDIIRRHDVSFRYTKEKMDFSTNFSWDESPKETVRTSLYRHGFRAFSMGIGRIFHCLRGEIQFSYDFESSGSTVLMRFGPRMLGEVKPTYRYAL